MAGDWMKIELELPDKPEVHSIAAMLHIDPDCVVGKLIRVWQWFDKHTTDGNAYGVTYTLPDRISGVTGFGEAMSFVGWLEQKDKFLHMPKFDRHTSESAKKRAQTQKRVAKSRANEKGGAAAECNAESVTKTLPREEKRREEVNTTLDARFDFKGELVALGVSEDVARDFVATRKAKKLAQTETAFKHIVKEAGVAGISLDDAIHICCKRGWGGFESKWLKPEDKVSSVSWKDNPLLAGAI